MPRANRYFLPGQIWHITHRCHKQSFLLRFACDRRNYLRWLFEAKKRFGVCVLDKRAHREWLAQALTGTLDRDDRWSTAIAVGSEAFVAKVKSRLGAAVTAREIATASGLSILREDTAAYDLNFGVENDVLTRKTGRLSEKYAAQTNSS